MRLPSSSLEKGQQPQVLLNPSLSFFLNHAHTYNHYFSSDNFSWPTVISQLHCQFVNIPSFKCMVSRKNCLKCSSFCYPLAQNVQQVIDAFIKEIQRNQLSIGVPNSVDFASLIYISMHLIIWSLAPSLPDSFSTHLLKRSVPDREAPTYQNRTKS